MLATTKDQVYDTVFKRRKDEEAWGEISLAQCIKETEGKGYYTKGSVEFILNGGRLVETHFAVYSVAPF